MPDIPEDPFSKEIPKSVEMEHAEPTGATTTVMPDLEQQEQLENERKAAAEEQRRVQEEAQVQTKKRTRARYAFTFKFWIKKRSHLSGKKRIIPPQHKFFSL